jgi:redox-sensing transcriptional repressor
MNRDTASARPADPAESRPSRATVGRLSLYLRQLEGILGQGTLKISSRQLGQAIGITDVQVRKDITYLGNLGQPGIGYPTQDLIAAIRRVLCIDREWAVALVGVGNLARALLRYKGFLQRGFRIVALFDADPSKVGQRIEGLEVHPPERMREVIAATKTELGLLAVPSDSAQAVADSLVNAGVRGLVNFAPVVLRLPVHVSLVAVDLTVQLEQLAFQVQHSDVD